MSKRTEPQPAIRREEWDFSEISPLMADVCLRYELTREMENPAGYFVSLTAKQAAEEGIVPLTNVPGLQGIEQDYKGTSLARLKSTYHREHHGLNWGEWEYVEMLPALYFSHGDGHLRPYPEDIMQTPWPDLKSDWRRELTLRANEAITGFRSFRPEAVDADRMREPERFARFLQPGPIQLFTARVNWTKNDAALLHDFALWLKTRRPTSLPSTSDVGRQSVYDDLKALSAMRLRHYYFADEATKLTKSVLGKPLYADGSTWDRAARRGVELFLSFYPGAGEPKSAVRKRLPRGRPKKKNTLGFSTEN